MKLFNFFFVACMFSLSGLAQSNTDIYLDENGQRISKLEFNAHSENNVGYFYLEGISENGKVFFIEKRVVNGRVSLEVVNELRTHLQNLSQSEINENNILVVNYYPGPDSCNQSGTITKSNSRLKSYYRRISRQKDVNQFFIYKSDEGLGFRRDGITWYPDENNLWQSHFFKHHYPCNSFVIVRPDGHFYLMKGEYDTRRIFKWLKELR
jgi:hypothetical protein